MKRNFALAAFAALALTAGVASAAEVNGGQRQIANYLGVNADAYSANELAQLLSARRSGDQSTFAFLAAGGAKAADVTSVNPGKEQLASLAGLDASQYTSAELVRVRAAQLRGDSQTVAFFVSHQNRNDVRFDIPRGGRD